MPNDDGSGIPENPEAPTDPASMPNVSVTSTGGDMDWKPAEITSTQGKIARIPAQPEPKDKSKDPTTPAEVDVKITLDYDSDQVIVNFGRLVTWVGMRPDKCRLFARLLWHNANELEKNVPRAKVIQMHPKKKEPT